MKSKLFDVHKYSPDKVKQNKTVDFVNYYKPASETNVKLVQSRKADDDVSGSNNSMKNKTHKVKPKRERVLHKITKSKGENMSVVNKDEDSFPHVVENSFLDNTKVTSTPNENKKEIKVKGKSIMKKEEFLDSSLNLSNQSISSKPKKRNKSVSFMLDEGEEIDIKRSKSEESVIMSKTDKPDITNATKKPKKEKKKNLKEKENIADKNNSLEIAPSETSKTHLKRSKELESLQLLKSNSVSRNEIVKDKIKNKKVTDSLESESQSCNIENEANNSAKEGSIRKIKSKKKKNIIKCDATNTEDQPHVKGKKKILKPDIIAQDLKNLNIGDNTHTLTSLLDDMTVVDESQKKKKVKGKKKPIVNNNQSDICIEGKGENDTQEKEKVKWVKRKWNKDKKGGLNFDKHLTSIIIENLPLKIMCNYKKLLAEYFEKLGMIKQVGIAEVYPMQEPKPVFTTTISFYSEEAADKACEEDNIMFQGNHIRVRKSLPPTETTLVVRSYAELTEQALSSVFADAGRIRSIRHLVKGKKSLATAFIEFDGPTSVERAMKLADDARIGGKKIHVAKFEQRNASKKKRKETTSENDDGSCDSIN